MSKRLGLPISVALAISVGGIVLLGYFLEIELLQVLRQAFLQWAVVLSAVALLLGVVNLLAAHWRKATTSTKGAGYSMILIASMIITIVVVGLYRPTGEWSQWIFKYVQLPAESSLLALVAVVLVYASARLLSRKPDAFSLVFIVTALIILMGTATLPFLEIPGLAEARAWIARLPAAAGARGILLGVALGALATGLRILIGSDRPYGG
jgi:hypothetical protein